MAVETQGLPWFDRFGSPHEVPRTLLFEDALLGGPWESGTRWSMDRAGKVFHTALHVGEWQVAREQAAWLLDDARRLGARRKTIERMREEYELEVARAEARHRGETSVIDSSRSG